MMIKRFVLFLVCATAWLPAAAAAHGVRVVAHFEGSEIHSDSFYLDGKPVAGAPVTVFDDNGKIIMEGSTGEDGAFDFPDPGSDQVQIVLRAPSGHLGEAILGKEPATAGRQGPPADVRKTVVEQTMDQQLAAIQGAVLSLQRQLAKPRASEIFGGLGWIVGLAGAYMWGASRRRDQGRSEG